MPRRTTEVWPSAESTRLPGEGQTVAKPNIADRRTRRSVMGEWHGGSGDDGRMVDGEAMQYDIATATPIRSIVMVAILVRWILRRCWRRIAAAAARRRR